MDAIVEELKSMSIEVSGRKGMAEVATISAKDVQIGELVADIIEKVGKDGVVTVEESKSSETTFDIVEGLQFDKATCRPTSSPIRTEWKPCSKIR